MKLPGRAAVQVGVEPSAARSVEAEARVLRLPGLSEVGAEGWQVAPMRVIIPFSLVP